jgi:hypothetical protein
MALLSEFAAARVCGWCKRPLRFPAHPHHLFARGIGSGSRLDVRENLIPLGGPWDCNCHGEVHAGRIQRFDLLAVVAAREHTTQDAIEREIFRLRRLPKGVPR